MMNPVVVALSLLLVNSGSAVGDTLQASAMRKLYDTLFGAYHSDDAFAAMAQPGLTLNPADYASGARLRKVLFDHSFRGSRSCPRSVVFPPAGDAAAVEKFSFLCNSFPGLDAVYTEQGLSRRLLPPLNLDVVFAF